MTTIRERLVDLVLGPEKQQLQRVGQLLLEAYQQGPFEAPPEQLLAKLMEYDSQVVQDMVMQLQWDTIGGYGMDDEDRQRTLSVKKSRRLWRYDPLFEHLIRLWTNYGFGESIELVTDDKRAQAVWDRFWTSDENAAILADDAIQSLSNDVLIDGEIYFIYFIAKQGGAVKIRVIDTDEIIETVTDPEDKTQVLFYKRMWRVGDKDRVEYYPDWLVAFGENPEAELGRAMLPERSIRADQTNDQTTVVIQHVAHNKKRSIHGWPLLSTGAAWVSAHKRFREDRASVAAGMAMYIQKIKVDGGSRAVDAIKAAVQSSLVTNRTAHDRNPPAAPGSTFLENEAATLEKLPMSTGAGDAQVDGNALLMMACLSAGVFPHYAGAGEAFRLATASAMEGPILRNWSRYQLFWSSQFRRMYRIVLMADEKANGVKYESYKCEVSIDRLIEVDLPAVTTTVSSLFKDVLAPGMESGMIPKSVVQGIAGFSLRMILQALGATDAAEIASDEALMTDDEATQEAIVALADLAERGEFTAEQVGRLCERLFGGGGMVAGGGEND